MDPPQVRFSNKADHELSSSGADDTMVAMYTARQASKKKQVGTVLMVSVVGTCMPPLMTPFFVQSLVMGVVSITGGIGVVGMYTWWVLIFF
jgi:hypothetical protein